MTVDPSLRASDDDRENVAGRLRDAHAEGPGERSCWLARCSATSASGPDAGTASETNCEPSDEFMIDLEGWVQPWWRGRAGFAFAADIA